VLSSQKTALFIVSYLLLFLSAFIRWDGE